MRELRSRYEGCINGTTRVISQNITTRNTWVLFFQGRGGGVQPFSDQSSLLGFNVPTNWKAFTTLVLTSKQQDEYFF